MTSNEPTKQPSTPWQWILALIAVLAWCLLAAGAADAQQTQVPDYVLAQVLGEAAPKRPPMPIERDTTVNLVASHMLERFEDQLVAGVERPKVELEVQFDWDSDRIKGENGPQIEAAARVLNVHLPDTRFRVAGYTDASGDADYNLSLSERRAGAVWRALVDEHGVDEARLERVGFGEENPLDGASEEDRRRVELQILH